MKKILSLLLCALLMVGMIPTFAMADTVTDTWAVKLNVSETDSYKYNNQNCIALSFNVQSDNLKLKNAQNMILAVDLDVFDFLGLADDEETVEVYNANSTNFVENKSPLAEGCQIKKTSYWQIKVYFAKDATGKIGYIKMLASSTAEVDVTTAKDIAKAYIGLKSGKTVDDITSNSIRFITSTEANALKQNSAIEITNGNTHTQQAIIGAEAGKTPAADTLKVKPTINWIGITPKKPALTGTVEITGTAKIGETLTATTSNMPSDATSNLEYQWYRDDVAIGGATEKSTYTPSSADDVGKAITVEVSSPTNYTGTIKPASATAAVAKKDAPEAPTGLAETDKTDTTIKVTPNDAWEYSKDNGSTWQNSNEFTGLTANTPYSIIARVKATDTQEASLACTAITVTTEKKTAGTEERNKLEAAVNGYYSEYDGNAHSAVTVNGLPSGWQVAGYDTVESGDFNLNDSPTVTNVSDSKTVYVKFTNDNYKDAVILGFNARITQKNISSATVTLDSNGLTYNGSEQKKEVESVEVDGKPLTADKDYTVSGNKATDAGTHTVTITGIGNYTGESTNHSFVIDQLKVELRWDDVSSLIYDGSAKNVSATVANKKNSNDVTVVVTDGNQTNVGHYTATATSLTGAAKDNYTLVGASNTTKDYNITRANMENVAAAFTAYNEVYDGKAHSITVDKSKIRTVNSQPVTITYGVSDGDRKDEDPAERKDVGTTTVYWYVTAPNHEPQSGSTTITISQKNASDLFASEPNQNTVVKIGTFNDPTIKLNANGEDGLGGTFKYTMTVPKGDGTSETKATDESHENIVEALKNLAKDVVATLQYTFTPTDTTNYTGTKTGDFKVTVKDIEFTGAENAVTVKKNPAVYGDKWSDILSLDGTKISASVDGTSVKGKYKLIDADGNDIDLNAVPSAGTTIKYNIAFTGGSYSNTKVFATNKSITINPKTLTAGDLMHIGSTSKTYDGNASAPEGLEIAVKNSALVGSDKLTVTGTWAYDNKAAGESKVLTFTPNAITSGNYSLAADQVYTINNAVIEQKEVTVTGITVDDRKYDGTTKVTLAGTSAGVTGAIDDDNVTVDLTDATATVDSADASDVAKAVTVKGVALTGDDAGNYKLSAQPTGLTVTISKADPKVTAPTGKANLVYDGTAQELITAGSTTGGELQYQVGDGDYANTIPKGKDAANYTIKYKVVGDTNYNDVAEKTLTGGVTIAPKSVTVKPKDVTVPKGTAPTLELAFGEICGDDKFTASPEPTFTLTDANDAEVTDVTKAAAGTYTITWTNKGSVNFTAADGTTAANYTLTKSNDTGTLTVMPSYSGGGGGSASTVQKPVINNGDNGTYTLSADGTTATFTPNAGYEIDKATVNGNVVTPKDGKLTGLKTGDNVKVTYKKADSTIDQTTSIKDKVAALELMARSSKTSKKNIKVVLKMSAEAQATIDEIQSLGYTVKYKFYRSTKKSASYKVALTKTSKTYLNTVGTKGTMYYYKARVQVYDVNGNLVTQTELKQCKYANRQWTK